MTNAEAIETLRANYPDACYEQLREAVDKAIKALEAQEWVPCKERLSEEETDVLICNSIGNIEISRGSYSTEASDWIWYTSGWRFGEVIAWKPLPEPYKEDGNEDR